MTNRFGDVGTHPQLTRLALHLSTTGHDVRAISLATPGTITGMFSEAGIETEVIDTSRRGSLVPVVVRLATLFRKWRPEAVVAFLYETIVPARLAAQLAGVPAMISSIRNEYFGPRHRELVIRATERLSAATVVNSRRVAESLVRRGIANRRHLVVIHNGIDVSLFRTDPEAREVTRRSLSLREDDFVWLTIGRLTEQKAYPNLFRAFSTVVDGLPSSRLLVAGRGPLRGELEDLVLRSGLRDRVSLLGFRGDIPGLLAASDAFVMASRWEGMPNAVMEALAAGVPVVGTDVGGMGELIHDRRSGYLVPSGAPDELAMAMVRMMKTPLEERRDMGRSGEAAMRQHYEYTGVMEAWWRLISNAVRSGVE